MLSQYSRAADAPVRVSQYHVMSSSMRSRSSARSGTPSQSVQDRNFSTIQAAETSR